MVCITLLHSFVVVNSTWNGNEMKGFAVFMSKETLDTVIENSIPNRSILEEQKVEQKVVPSFQEEPTQTPSTPKEIGPTPSRIANRVDPKVVPDVIQTTTKRVFKSGRVIKIRSETKDMLAIARSNLIPKPANAKEMYNNLKRGFKKLNIFDDRPRSDFYTVSDANVNEDKPILMDAFTYCEKDRLHLDAIFNIKYLVVKMKKRVAYKSLDDLWLAKYRGVVVPNEMKKDNHKHTIVGSFTFPFGCRRHDGNFTVFSNATQFSYSFAPSFIPSFTTPHYYLSVCTSIGNSPESQVLYWLNYHYYQGVQHFTIYLNGRVAAWKQILRPYIEKGLVDAIEYTYPNHRYLFEQNSALNACNRRYRFASQFVLYNDVDEFMLPLNQTWRLVDVVRLYDTSFPQVEAFRVGVLRLVESRFSIRSILVATTPTICGNRHTTFLRSALFVRRRLHVIAGLRIS